MTRDTSFDVGVAFTSVPDGFNTDTGKCRISLQVVPVPEPSSGQLTVDIRHWPTEIQKISGKIRVAAGQVTFPNGPDIDGGYLPGTVASDVASHPRDAEFAQDAEALW